MKKEGIKTSVKLCDFSVVLCVTKRITRSYTEKTRSFTERQMKKIIFILLSICCVAVYGQSEKGKICFHFIDQYGNSVKPNKVEIIDNEGTIFRLSENYCFDYCSQKVVDMVISSNNYYEYRKQYRIPFPKTDTIVLRNMITSVRFFFTSETPVLTDDEIKYFQDFFSNEEYHFFSLSLVINNIGKYKMSELQNTIAQIYNLYLSNFLSKNFQNSIQFSVYFEKDNLNLKEWIEDYDSKKIYYLFHGEAIKTPTK